MTKTKLNLNKLKEEIDRRKSEDSLGSAVTAPQTRNTFINQLRKSFETGVHTESVDKIKKVANEATRKLNEKHATGEDVPFKNVRSTPQTSTREKQVIGEDFDNREEKLFNSFTTANKKTLADTLESHLGGGRRNFNEQQQFPQQINEQVLINKIDERLNNYLIENIGDIFNDSIKTVILEHFAKEKIKEVLLENKDVLKEMVISVIRELQKKKKTP